MGSQTVNLYKGFMWMHQRMEGFTLGSALVQCPLPASWGGGHPRWGVWDLWGALSPGSHSHTSVSKQGADTSWVVIVRTLMDMARSSVDIYKVWGCIWVDGGLRPEMRCPQGGPRASESRLLFQWWTCHFINPCSFEPNGTFVVWRSLCAFQSL